MQPPRPQRCTFLKVLCFLFEKSARLYEILLPHFSVICKRYSNNLKFCPRVLHDVHYSNLMLVLCLHDAGSFEIVKFTL